MYRDGEQRDFARRLRSLMTEPEKRLWRALRAQQLKGYKFRRQAAVGPYVVDFVCFASKLIGELDGPQHQEAGAAEHDARRTAWLALRGYRVLRFRNHELDDGVQLVVGVIRQALAKAQSSVARPPSPTLPAEGREPEELMKNNLDKAAADGPSADAL